MFAVIVDPAIPNDIPLLSANTTVASVTLLAPSPIAIPAPPAVA